MSDADSLRNFVNAAYRSGDVTDPSKVYDQRDAILAKMLDNSQSILKMVHAVIADSATARAASAERERRMEAKIDRIADKVENLEEHNRLQDRVSSHTSQIAEEALTLANHPELQGDVRRQATLWGGIIAAIVTLGPAVIQHLVAPLLEKIGPY